jgi:serine/threonine protein kinase/tetratricopeptide (TPR) repeat protein
MAERASEQSIFLHAIGLPSPEERAAYLDEACRGDPALRAELDALLAAHDRLGGGLADTGVRDAATTVTPVAEAAGTVLAGRYRLLEEIGEGGMGTVWRAEQLEPVRRLVAVKLVKAGMDTKAVLGRFEAERQALALMDHPNIAKVLDAGTTAGEPGGVSPGRPFFVLELVKGVAITRFCDEHRLTPRERLELFVPVCQAIQHAHQKGVIHRDIKPSNVLVARYDGKPVPKVIDFGVAKATEQRLTEETLHTAVGAIVGTLEYMSPEQAGSNQLDVDTRTDVYSLGALLYELLAGSPPFSRGELAKAAGVLEMLKVIREQEPSKPSTRLSTAERLPTLAANRGTEPRRLTAQVRGELDWIVLKCLEKDRTRRYETAGGLARDVERYLHDEPVRACPPSAGYRLGKVVRRNRGAVLTASAVLLALVGGILATTSQAVRATRAERHAQAQRRQAHQTVNDYFTRVSESTLLQEPTLEPLRRQLLQAALSYYQGFVREQDDDPEMRAELAATYFRISMITMQFGADEDWLPAYEKGIAVAEDLLSRKPDLASLQSLQAGVFRLSASGYFHARDPDAALRSYEKARSLWEELVREHPTVTGFQNDLAATHLAIGILHYFAQRHSEAVRSFEKSRALWRQLVRANPDVPPYRAALALCETNLSIELAVLGEAPRARDLSREAVATAKSLVADFPGVPALQAFVSGLVDAASGLVFEQTGRPQEAEAAYRQMLAGQEALLRDYPLAARYQNGVFRARLWLGELLWADGRRAEAGEVFRPLHALGEKLNGADPQAQNLLACFLATCPDLRFRDAQRAVVVSQKVVERVPQYVSYRLTLGAAHYARGDYAKAALELERATRLPNPLKDL